MRALPLLFILSACAAPAAQGPTREAETLARELVARTAGAEESCIPADRQTNLRIVDARTLVYETGRTLWVNNVVCPGMRPMDTLVVELQGSQYCRGDRFRTLSAGGTIPGPTCVLESFTPYRR